MTYFFKLAPAYSLSNGALVHFQKGARIDFWVSSTEAQLQSKLRGAFCEFLQFVTAQEDCPDEYRAAPAVTFSQCSESFVTDCVLFQRQGGSEEQGGPEKQGGPEEGLSFVCGNVFLGNGDFRKNRHNKAFYAKSRMLFPFGTQAFDFTFEQTLKMQGLSRRKSGLFLVCGFSQTESVASVLTSAFQSQKAVLKETGVVFCSGKIKNRRNALLAVKKVLSGSFIVACMDAEEILSVVASFEHFGVERSLFFSVFCGAVFTEENSFRGQKNLLCKLCLPRKKLLKKAMKNPSVQLTEDFFVQLTNYSLVLNKNIRTLEEKTSAGYDRKFRRKDRFLNHFFTGENNDEKFSNGE